MGRSLATEALLFLAPFALYAVFLGATRVGVMEPKAWPLSRVIWLAVCALALMIGSFVYLASYSGSPPGSAYVPAHMENGKLVPGRHLK